MAAPGSAEEFARKELRRGVFHLLKDFGFSSAHDSEVSKLAEVWRRVIIAYAEKVRLFMEATGRTMATVDDVLAAFRLLRVSVTELKNYGDQVRTTSLPALPMFPVPGPTEISDEEHYAAMYGPRPSQRELECRPPHVPDYLPAMHPEWIEEEALALKMSKLKRPGKYKGYPDDDKKADKKAEKKPFKLPVFDNMSFHELGFVSDEEKEDENSFKTDLSSITGIKSSANLPGALLAAAAAAAATVRGDTEAGKPTEVATPVQPLPKDVVKQEPLTPQKFLDILKSRVNSPALVDRPSSSASNHSVEGVVKPIKFNTKPVVVKPLKPPKKEKEPKPPPKPKGRPPKKRDDAALKKKKLEESFLANQKKQLEKFREEKERKERQEFEEKIKNQLLKSLKDRSSFNIQPNTLPNPLKINLGNPINFASILSPKPPDVATHSAAATPPMPSLVAEVPPPVGAEVSIGNVEEEEETIPFIDNIVSEPAQDSAPVVFPLDTTIDANTTAETTITETPAKEKKKKHKDKIVEQSGEGSDKKHKKKDKDSEEYKEYKRLKKEKKRREREEKEKKEVIEEKIKAPETPKISLKIKFGDPDGLGSGNLATSDQSIPMRTNSRASDRPGSSRDHDKEPMQQSVTLKFKNLFSPAELANNEPNQKVPPLKLGAVPRLEEHTDRSNNSTPSKSKKDKKDKEKKKDRKEKERHHERERELEREREREEREREKERRREEERKEQERIAIEKKLELERQRLAAEAQKEKERKELERLREAERQREAAEKARKEAEKERERKKEEKKKEKKHKKKAKSKSKDPSPLPAQTRPIVPLLSADDDEDDDDDDEEEVWICPVCSVAYTEGANMVCCDSCDDWFHWHCVGLIVEPAKNTSWFCQRCSGKKKHKELKRPGSRTDERGGPKKKKRH